MPTTLKFAETSAIADLADALYSFLPGSGARYTWAEVAHENDVPKFWSGGSKLPAITALFEQTYEYERAKFCDLLITAIQGGLKYRVKKGDPVTREEISKINSILLRLEFKIPELHEPRFLAGLASGLPAGNGTATPKSPPRQKQEQVDLESLRKRFAALVGHSDAHARGYAFEKFLEDFFGVHDMNPGGSFKLLGEQIDGTFEWEGFTYIVEARWRTTPARAADLYVLRGKAEKSEWTRGLFISINDFTDLSSESFANGRRANLITMSGHDLILILEGQWSLFNALKVKLRRTGETNNVYVPLATSSR